MLNVVGMGVAYLKATEKSRLGKGRNSMGECGTGKAVQKWLINIVRVICGVVETAQATSTVFLRLSWISRPKKLMFARKTAIFLQVK